MRRLAYVTFTTVIAGMQKYIFPKRLGNACVVCLQTKDIKVSWDIRHTILFATAFRRCACAVSANLLYV